MLKKLLLWILSHKRIIFIYIPILILLIIALYSASIYLSWLDDKEEAMDRLSRYKRLIDRTEEIREGYIYSYSVIDLSAKVVDIPTRIYDRNNEIIGEFFEQKREIVPLSYIPEWLIKATIASEDRRFYSHSGISYKGIARAMFVNLINFRVVQGGSTITQQLAKVLFTDMERSFKRKIYEAFCAFEIEKRYDKEDILSMYLNLIYFGNGAYGVESTAKMFFGKSVKELSETECAMIVATISNPAIYSPLSDLKIALNKTKRIMKSMIDAGFINESTAESQLDIFTDTWDFSFDENGNAVSSQIGSSLYSSYRLNRAPFFNERIRRVLIEKFGEETLKRGGLSVYTTIDADKQDIAIDSLRQGIIKQREYHISMAETAMTISEADMEKEKAENIEGAFIAIDPNTGEMVSYVGGYSFSSKSQLDHVSQIKRQPGSSFKPIIYTAALEARDITPSTVFVDEEITFEDDYSPSNYNNNYLGSLIVREALRRSVNIIAVKVLDRTGYDLIFKILENGLEISDEELNKRFGRTLSLALGTYELSPLENCILHSTIVNGGKFIKPYGIRYVKDYNGNIVWNNEDEIRRHVEEKREKIGRLIDPISCAITVSMLKGVFEQGGTAYYAILNKGIDFPIAGKTGTTSNFNDAWFAGYTHNLVSVVWIGNNTGAVSLGEKRAGSVVAAPVWTDFISKIYVHNKPGDFGKPDEGISEQTICLDSGLVPHSQNPCPRTSVELYYSGSEPGDYCNINHDE